MASKDERVVADDDDFDCPLQEGSSPGGIAPPEGKSAPAEVSPRGGRVSSRKLAHEFFQDKTLHIAEDGRRKPTRRPRKWEGAP